MAVTYKKLFHLLIDKGMTDAELMEKAGFSAKLMLALRQLHFPLLTLSPVLVLRQQVEASELKPKIKTFL